MGGEGTGGEGNGGQRGVAGLPQRRSTAWPISITVHHLPYGLSRFSEIPNILVNNSTWGCPWSKILTPKILFDHVEYVSHNFVWLTSTFFLIWGVLRGAKKPLRGVPAPQFSKWFSSWTLDFAEKKFQLDRSKTLACSLSQNSKN